MADSVNDYYGDYTLSQSQTFDITASQAATRPQVPLFLGDDRSRMKAIMDNVHDQIYLDSIAVDIVDTPVFQRLRDVKQLGLCHQVYPTAVHTRFEHSLGVCWLSRVLFGQCLQAQKKDLDLEWRDGRLLQIAGLCHDLGHGPFSHVFDSQLLQNPDVLREWPALRDWKHEQMSANLLEYIVKEYGVDEHEELLDKSGLGTVQDYILAASEPHRIRETGQRRFLYDVVANGRNSIDVDKFDYIERDCLATKQTPGFNYKRLIQNMHIIDGEMCYHKNSGEEVYSMFQTRGRLFRSVYTHAKVKAVESMVAEALLEANRYLKFMEKVNDVERFWQLDDTLLKRVEFSEEPELAGSRAIISGLRRREIYKICGEYRVPREDLEHFKEVTVQDISSAGSTNVRVRPEDIVVHNTKVNFSMGDKNPVDSVHFYVDRDSAEKIRLSKDQITHMLPDIYQEYIVRVYSKKCRKNCQEDRDHQDAVAKLFHDHQRRKYKKVSSTPQKKRPRLEDEVAYGEGLSVDDDF